MPGAITFCEKIYFRCEIECEKREKEEEEAEKNRSRDVFFLVAATHIRKIGIVCLVSQCQMERIQPDKTNGRKSSIGNTQDWAFKAGRAKSANQNRLLK